jgi:hypothetical protein
MIYATDEPRYQNGKPQASFSIESSEDLSTLQTDERYGLSTLSYGSNAIGTDGDVKGNYYVLNTSGVWVIQ